jgi:hypothetical protein
MGQPLQPGPCAHGARAWRSGSPDTATVGRAPEIPASSRRGACRACRVGVGRAASRVFTRGDKRLMQFLRATRTHAPLAHRDATLATSIGQSHPGVHPTTSLNKSRCLSNTLNSFISATGGSTMPVSHKTARADRIMRRSANSPWTGYVRMSAAVRKWRSGPAAIA